MPKDPTKNINRYKIRGGHLNPFEYQHNQDAVSRQKDDDWMEEQASDAAARPDQAEAERIRRLLAAHGEPAPASPAKTASKKPGQKTAPRAKQSAEQKSKTHTPTRAKRAGKASTASSGKARTRAPK